MPFEAGGRDAQAQRAAARVRLERLLREPPVRRLQARGARSFATLRIVAVTVQVADALLRKRTSSPRLRTTLERLRGRRRERRAQLATASGVPGGVVLPPTNTACVRDERAPAASTDRQRDRARAGRRVADVERHALAVGLAVAVGVPGVADDRAVGIGRARGVEVDVRADRRRRAREREGATGGLSAAPVPGHAPHAAVERGDVEVAVGVRAEARDVRARRRASRCRAASRRAASSALAPVPQ